MVFAILALGDVAMADVANLNSFSTESTSATVSGALSKNNSKGSDETKTQNVPDIIRLQMYGATSNFKFGKNKIKSVRDGTNAM